MDSTQAARKRKPGSDIAPTKSQTPDTRDSVSSIGGTKDTGVETYTQAILWSIVCGLTALGLRCWLRYFRPQFDGTWADPPWAWSWDLATMAMGKSLYLWEVSGLAGGTSSSTQPGSKLKLAFALLSWLQIAQYVSTNFVREIRPEHVYAVKALFFSPMIAWAWYEMSWAFYGVATRTTGAKGLRAFLLGYALDGVVFANVLKFPALPVARLVSRVPYSLLPDGWLLATVVSTTSALLALWTAWKASPPSSNASRLLSLVAVGPPILFAAYGDSHAPTVRGLQRLNAKLEPTGFEVLARGDGRATGYASVIQDNKNGFRALRCGHSLLGGHWLESPGEVKDPIYGIFVMLEAVRLIEPVSASKQRRDSMRKLAKSGSVLNIGLGIGTAPAAFIRQGMSVTIVEIDQIVYDFARDYFELPGPHIAVIGDAIQFVRMEQSNLLTQSAAPAETASSEKTPGLQYDFIVHDVFTGGVEPAELFTFEFLTGLSDLLSPQGSIAINYAGDFELPAAQLVLRTILAVFPECRMFRETPESMQEANEGDQTNVVLFCRKVKGEFEFRRPERSDILRAPSREKWLAPQHEMQTEKFRPRCAEVGLRGCNGNYTGGVADSEALLTRANVAELEAWQAEAGRRHWRLMRNVIPPEVWDNW